MSDGRGGSDRRRGPDDAFRDLLDEARADEAARSRSVERWQRQRAEEGASFVGALLDVGEKGELVTVTTVAGGEHRGRIAGVARDFLEIRSADGRVAYLRLETVAILRPGADVGHDAASAERVGRHDRTFAEQLGRLAADRPRITLIALTDREPVTGELRSVGDDVVTVRLDGPARDVAYVRTASVMEAILHDG